jgi:cation transport ATPase
MVVAALIADPAAAAWRRGMDTSGSTSGLAVLLIGCPCALVISTPAAIAAALSAGARRGPADEGRRGAGNAGQGRQSVAFDKTGTLTEGKPKVTDIIGVARDEKEVLRLAAALEAGSSHPLAVAILDGEGGDATTYWSGAPPMQALSAARASSARSTVSNCSSASPQCGGGKDSPRRHALGTDRRPQRRGQDGVGAA